jgi:hypothetical protein
MLHAGNDSQFSVTLRSYHTNSRRPPSDTDEAPAQPTREAESQFRPQANLFRRVHAELQVPPPPKAPKLWRTVGAELQVQPSQKLPVIPLQRVGGVQSKVRRNLFRTIRTETPVEETPKYEARYDRKKRRLLSMVRRERRSSSRARRDPRPLSIARRDPKPSSKARRDPIPIHQLPTDEQEHVKTYTHQLPANEQEQEQENILELSADERVLAMAYIQRLRSEKTQDETKSSDLPQATSSDQQVPRVHRNSGGRRMTDLNRTPESSTGTPSRADLQTSKPPPSSLGVIRAVLTSQSRNFLAYERRKRTYLRTKGTPALKRIRRAVPTILSAISTLPASIMERPHLQDHIAAMRYRTRTIPLFSPFFEARPARKVLIGETSSEENSALPYATDSPDTVKAVIEQLHKKAIARKIAAQNRALSGTVRKVLSQGKQGPRRRRLRREAVLSRGAVPSGGRFRGLARRPLVSRVSAWLSEPDSVSQTSVQQEQQEQQEQQSTQPTQPTRPTRPARVFGSRHLRHNAVVEWDDERSVDTSRELEWVEESESEAPRRSASLIVRGGVAGVDIDAGEEEAWGIRTVEVDPNEELMAAERERMKAERREEKRAEWEAKEKEKEKEKAEKKVVWRRRKGGKGAWKIRTAEVDRSRGLSAEERESGSRLRGRQGR